MKKLFELLVCFLHPLAVVLMWLDLAVDRPDLKWGGKLAWGSSGLSRWCHSCTCSLAVICGDPGS